MTEPSASPAVPADLLDPPLPPGFARAAFERSWDLRGSRAAVWDWLSDPATFTEGQVPPYRVEFLPLADGRPGGLVEGCLNVHHGPLLSVHGVMGEQRPPAYRDLRYAYGSYVLSLRLVRPQRLEFWLDEGEGGGTRLRVRLEAQVRAGFAPLWQRLCGAFWWSFGRWARRATRPSR